MRFISVVAVFAVTLLAACSGSESGPSGTSALAKQMVGHWSTRGNDDLYFGAIEAASKTGSYVLVHPDGKAFAHRYEIDSEDLGDRTITATMLFASGDRREHTFTISEDGNSMESATIVTGIETRSQLSKVDDQTAP